MSIESLKEQARRHEQNEEWSKALEQYKKALSELARDDQVDIGLYNRVGDLFVRVGELAEAVENYEKAVDLYREAFLPNNAIAVCKKIIRHVPTHHQAYLKIGQIRAEQGFLPDARTNFLTYAERMQKSGELDESFRALIEFCDLAPDDVGVRITVAEQMAASGRTEEAVEQLMTARQHLARKGESEKVAQVETQIASIDPDVDLSRPPVVEAFGGAPAADDGAVSSDFAEIMFQDPPNVPDDLRDAAEQFVVSASGSSEEGGDDAEEMEFRITSPAERDESESFDDQDGEEAPELPMISFDDEDDAEAEPLPTFDFEEDEPELPTVRADEGDADVAPALPTFSFDHDEPADAPDAARAMEDAVEEAASAPTLEPPTLTPPALEPPPAELSVPTPPPHETPPPPEEPVVPPPPVDEPEPATPGHFGPDSEDVRDSAATPSEPEATRGGEADDGYVDLGAMILGEAREERTTRFKVAYEEPSGDEEADFARMLDQFKEKVSENLDSADVRAHYDLGTAYKEMGLLNEAITSFQAALRASSHHLPTYELMGQTFIEMGQPDAAVRALRRAIEANPEVEDELVGIYYYLARAYEALDDRAAALEFYDRVFALDINFADVTERLRSLR